MWRMELLVSIFSSRVLPSESCELDSGTLRMYLFIYLFIATLNLDSFITWCYVMLKPNSFTLYAFRLSRSYHLCAHSACHWLQKMTKSTWSCQKRTWCPRHLRAPTTDVHTIWFAPLVNSQIRSQIYARRLNACGLPRNIRYKCFWLNVTISPQPCFAAVCSAPTVSTACQWLENKLSFWLHIKGNIRGRPARWKPQWH